MLKAYVRDNNQRILGVKHTIMVDDVKYGFTSGGTL
jgi:hypothetical protein